MRLTTWNVNGLRTTPLTPHLKSLSSDIICIQETKLSGTGDPNLESLALITNHTSYFSISRTHGYSGVATYTNTKSTPIAAGEGLSSATGGGKILTPPSTPPTTNGDDSDSATEATSGIGYTKETLDMILHEGRCVITDHGAFVLLNLYIPALTTATRLPFKRSFLCALRSKIDALRSAGRAIILAGDFNICPAAIDTAEPIPSTELKTWESQPSRTWLRDLLNDDFVDVFRHCNPATKDAYTCWSTATNARVNNFGVRIDLIIVDKSLVGKVRSVEVLQHIEGSDHCPVRMDMDVTIDVADVPPAFCTAFMKRFSYRQKTLANMFVKQGDGNGAAVPSLESEAVKKQRKERLKTEKGGGMGKEGASQKKRIAKRPRTSKTQARLSTFFTKKSEVPPTESSDVAATVAKEESGAQRSEPSQSGESFEAIMEESRRAAKKRRQEAKAWKKILTGPPPAPLCRHGVPAVLKTVGKSGENRGRTFYSCPYPAGIGKTADCKFFKWAPYKAGLHSSFT